MAGKRKDGKRTRTNQGVEKIAAILEKRLAQFPAAVRDSKLDKIHRIAANASSIRREKASKPSQTPAYRPLTQPLAESEGKRAHRQN